MLTINENGRPELKPTSRLALLWSFNPVTDYESPHQMVGSVLAHIGHMGVHGAVYWGLLFRVSEEKLGEFKHPLSGYLYNGSSHMVEYRVRIIDMSPGPRKEYLEYVPMWRTKDTKQENLYILIDQIDQMIPSRPITDFCFYEPLKRVEAPPSGNYLRIRDPLF